MMPSSDKAYVWFSRLDGPTHLCDSFRAILSDQERCQANAFRAEEHAREYILAHAALRFVLAECVDLAPSAVVFQAIPGHKPSLPAANNQRNLRFNLSHTQGAALVGVTVGREIGVDIEHRRPITDLERLAEDVLSPQEIRLWGEQAPSQRNATFYRIWTRKEAYLKATGMGLFRTPQKVTVPISSGPLFEPQPVEDRETSGDWRVVDVAVPRSFFASICWEGTSSPELVVNTIDLPRYRLGQDDWRSLLNDF